MNTSKQGLLEDLKKIHVLLYFSKQFCRFHPPSHLMCASTRTPTVASSLKLKQLWCNETQPTQHQRVSDLNMTEKRHLHL